MPFPSWLAYAFATLMMAVSVYCLFRLALARPLGRRIRHDVNAAHVLMGAAMAGMLVPSWSLASVGLWEVVFAAVGAYFLVLCLRFVAQRGVAGVADDRVHHLSHFAIHLVMAIAMLYMFWLGATGDGRLAMVMQSPHLGPGDPGLTILLVVVLIGSAVFQLDSIGRVALRLRLAGGTDESAGGVGGGEQRPWLAPRLEIGCHVAMCVAMGYMLVLMV